ncbi:hypothetical protein OKA04_18755 [Luteolibacter flavescens]|uniref:Uncharacterized protein n=1 Tax=Luteolibacter flavescens TaxID=1859460 RepID=A0ABT3FTD3_9BACT|nr:hypothetical protein [Luteolibacter flavescens]MCW1886787.1 hypothetical protein [Luteolibacter flavescens]
MHDDLAALLRHRKETIADHAFRDRDSAAHLDALKTVSEEILAWHQTHRGGIPARLEHFLTNCSFDKALVYLESGGTWTGH